MRSMCEGLERRQLLSAAAAPIISTFTIGIGVGNNDTRVHLVKAGIEVSFNQSPWTTISYPKGLTEIDIRPNNLNQTGGDHTVELWDDNGVFTGKVVIIGVNGAINKISVFNNAVPVKVVGGADSNNIENDYATGNYAAVDFEGGMRSSNNLFSTAGNTFEIGGIKGYNVMEGQNGNQTLQGANESTNIITFGKGGGYTRVVGGMKAKDVYHYVGSRLSTGIVIASKGSGDTLSTFNGAWPIGIIIQGKVVIVKA
jgi:hypothetical protein